MRSKKAFIAGLGFAILAMVLFPLWTQASVEEGDSLAGLVFPAPGTQEAMDYFGLEENKPFVLERLDKKYILFKVVDVYCPICHEQAPVFNRLYSRIQEEASLADSLCVFILAPQATPTELLYLYQAWKTPYPILADHGYILPGKIASLDTPYTILADRDGRVLYTHLGPMPETRETVRKLKEILEQ